MSERVIAPRNLPARLPFSSTLLVILCLDLWSASGWLCGIIGTVTAVYWALILYVYWNEKRVDIFPDKNQTAKELVDELKAARNARH